MRNHNDIVYEDPLNTDIPDREMAQLFEELQELHIQNEKMSKKCTSHKSDNLKLKEHILTQESQIEELENITKELRGQIEEMERKYAETTQIAQIQTQNMNTESDNKVRVLSERVAQLSIKVKQEEEYRNRLENVIKSQESNNSKLKERNDRLEKMMNGDDKSIRKLQDTLKQKEVVIQRLSQDLEKERKMRIDASKRFSLMEGQVENLQAKLMSSVEDNDSTTKLLEIMEGKIKRANESKESLREKLKIEEKKREEENVELCTLREEMTKICETVIAEKQHSKDLEMELDEMRSDQQQMAAELQEARNTEKLIRSELERMLEDKIGVERILEEKQLEHEKTLETLSERIEQYETQQAESIGHIKGLEQEVRDLKARDDEFRSRLSSLSQKLQKETEMKNSLMESLEKRDQEICILQEKRNAIQKKLEKEVKFLKKLSDEKDSTEELLKKAKLHIQDVDAKLFRKEKELDRLVQKHNLMQQELEKEKIKSDRTWTELEDALRTLKQTQIEKLNIEKSAKHCQELFEMKMNNKLNMLEKKCEYLKKLNDFSTNKDENNMTEVFVKEQQDRLIQLMSSHEELNETVNIVQTNLFSKERELEHVTEKMRQMEDLLNAHHKKKTNDLKGTKNEQTAKRILQLEKSIDEVLVEVAVEGIEPSKMNYREKSMAIVAKVQQMKRELVQLLIERDSCCDEIYALKKAQEEKQVADEKVTTTEPCDHKYSNDQYEELENRYHDLYEQCQKYKSWVIRFTANMKERRVNVDSGEEYESERPDDIPNNMVNSVMKTSSTSSWNLSQSEAENNTLNEANSVGPSRISSPHFSTSQQEQELSQPRSMTSTPSASPNGQNKTVSKMRKSSPTPSIFHRTVADKNATYGTLFLKNRR